MKRKPILFAILIVAGIFVSSCLNNNNKEDIQTPEEEMALLSEYIHGLENEGNNVDTTALGVFYVVMEEGEGAYPQIGDSITIRYNGYLMNGDQFDSSAWNFENGLWTFVLGDGNYIEGWNDGMKVINKGAKVQLMIPSSLAYGSTGYNIIPPNNTLIFVVEMVDIISD